MNRKDFDVIVIGGGINGAGIARDAALRGLSVLLLEKNDFGSGTSSFSSRLIHGGLRYLEYGELPLVYESLHDRRYLLKNAPHLVRPLRIVIPIFADSERGMHIVRLGMIAYDVLSLGKELPRHRMFGKRQAQRAFPSIMSEGLKGAAAYYDCQVQFAERLVIENILAAKKERAQVRNYCEVVEIFHDATAVVGLRYRDKLTGRTESVSARFVVNAAGPWVDDVLDTVADPALQRYMGGTKGSHVVVPRFAGAPDDAIYVEAKHDGRPIFIIPWNGQVLIGTTDIRVDEDPADVRATRAETDYLIDEVNRVFPAAELTPESVSFTYAGVRPLPRQTDGPASAITRKHIIKHHNHVARGLYSIIGGKLTTYRSLAEDTLDRINKDFDLDLPHSRTHRTPLPGADHYDIALRGGGSDRGHYSDLTRRHLHDVYGGRAPQVLKLAKAAPELSAVVCDWSGALAAEVVFAVRNEMARNLDDVLNRRTMIGLGPSRGIEAAEAVADAMAAELGWSAKDRQLELDRYVDRFGVSGR